MIRNLAKYIIRNLIRSIRLPAQIIVYWLSAYFPRNQKIWVFGCWMGNAFRGNSKFFFLYVRKYHTNIRAVWITKNKELYFKLKKQGIDVCYASSFEGYLISLRSKYFFVSHGVSDICAFLSRRGIIINLSHTIYHIKGLKKPRPKSLRQKIGPYLVNPFILFIKPDYAITSSNHTRSITERSYNIREDQVIEVGTPKTDFLLSPNNADFYLANEETIKEWADFRGKKLILFLPTWRSDPNFDLFGFGFDLQRINALLERINAILILNVNPLRQVAHSVPELNESDNLRYCSYGGNEMNQLLCKADALITDYSSLFADFLVYNRPIVFASFDHEKYILDRDFFIDYNQLPGCYAESWNELCECLVKLFVDGNDSNRIKREKLRDLIYPRLDGKSRERIEQFVNSLD